MNKAIVNPEFSNVLKPFGPEAANFFLAASLYHAHKVSFESAARLAGLSFERFHERLLEHFGSGFRPADEVIAEDLEIVIRL